MSSKWHERPPSLNSCDRDTLDVSGHGGGWRISSVSSRGSEIWPREPAKCQSVLGQRGAAMGTLSREGMEVPDARSWKGRCLLRATWTWCVCQGENTQFWSLNLRIYKNVWLAVSFDTLPLQRTAHLHGLPEEMIFFLSERFPLSVLESILFPWSIHKTALWHLNPLIGAAYIT